LTVNYIVGFKSGLTLRWIGEVWRLYSDTIFRSIGLGLACLAVDLIAGIPAAYVMVKTRSRFTRLLEEFLVMPLAIPGLAIALAILVSYGGWTAFRMSWLIILVGHVIFTLPFMIRSVIAVMTAINMEELEEGAASLGAGFVNRFIRVIIPNVLSGVLAGSLMVFTLSIGEFNLTWMLHTPLTKTLPVGLADSYASMRLEIGSAYTITFFFMIIPLLMGISAKIQVGCSRGRNGAIEYGKKRADIGAGSSP
jgi:ABC-type spermidine/putrescine transport system permease subunit II